MSALALIVASILIGMLAAEIEGKFRGPRLPKRTREEEIAELHELYRSSGERIRR